ncbi:potassium transporter Kup [Magnetospirillum moscoviense]|uniref:Probable potassium transport system protein Kup n=1 Tax=Magnetospirillum moscoviense TaxID=1437059 RepID=A0A178MXS0_9PROT|nr:potassium transporter Kup [Magnetospirillum moscoviense]MBF0324774.1 potassium transporter Kup [Alphaproteobacteria bacterium]OAN56897.1 potassium transport protein Kup [Magnetospirillum moscoviense]
MSAPDGAGHGHSRNVFALMFGAIGVVFGDIGTSPLYAMKETFAGPHPLALDRLHVFGVLSLVFWAVTIVVSIKYVIFIMRADNKGEGGSLALLALVGRAAQGRPGLSALVAALGIFAAALFYGDSMITPAISILSAVEGLQVVAPALDQYVVPLTIGILVILFAIQKHGTDAVGKMFGPIMIIWFTVLAVMGVRNIGLAPDVLKSLSPHWAILFLYNDGWIGFLALGSVVLAVTGAEALYADMGHFGRVPIRLAWYFLVLPALLLNYFGQGALLLTNPAALENPFFKMAPAWAGVPLLLLATCATVIASQAVISGAFSVTRQAIQLGYLPRMTIVHTSEQEIGQIYVPVLNWTLMIFVMALVLGFRTSSNLASAYGVAVTGTMVIDATLIGMVMLLLWGWKKNWVFGLVGLFLVMDLAFFLANSTKIPHGGWFPLAIGLVVFVFLTTWKRGRQLLMAKLAHDAMPVDAFLASLSARVTRVSGTAIFLTGTREGIPLALLHNLKHNKVVHERVVILTVIMAETPFVSADKRIEHEVLAPGFQRLTLRFGFMEDPNIPKTMAQAKTEQLGFFYEPMSISYFLSRETIIASQNPGMAPWREQLFAWMARSATNAMDFFQLPSNRVVELGSQVEI